MPLDLWQCDHLSSNRKLPTGTKEQETELPEELTTLFSPGTATSNHSHTYDVQGKVIDSRLIIMGVNASHVTYTYDAAGNKVEEVKYDCEGRFSQKSIFQREYDGNGNWIQELVTIALAWDVEFGLHTPTSLTQRTFIYW